MAVHQIFSKHETRLDRHLATSRGSYTCTCITMCYIQIKHRALSSKQKIVMYSCILSLQSQVHFDLLTYFGSSKKVSVFAFLFAETFLFRLSAVVLVSWKNFVCLTQGSSE